MVRTLRQHHMDYNQAVHRLTSCVWEWEPRSKAALIAALKNGSFDNNTKYTDEEINDLEATKEFKRRFSKHLMKKIRPPEIIENMLSTWFNDFKCSASEGSEPARGRYDTKTNKPLFTADTKTTVEEQKKNARHIQDTSDDILDMYRIISPTAGSTHGLPEYISLRPESSLEGFHNPLSNFANTGMRRSLADNLNLEGTARYSVLKRFRIWVSTLDVQQRAKNEPAHWANKPSFYNHSWLAHINELATMARCREEDLPFNNVRRLPKDNGER
jgi:hypothetical protein